MKVITRQELQNNSTAIMDAVEAGETFHVTRDGVAIAELVPVSRTSRLHAEQLVERHKNLPIVDGTRMRREADEFFGCEDRGQAGGSR